MYCMMHEHSILPLFVRPILELIIRTCYHWCYIVTIIIITSENTDIALIIVAVWNNLLQVGKQFDALLVDVQAPSFSSGLPVFDIFKKDTFEV